MKVKNALYLATAFSGCLLFAGFASGAKLKLNTQDFAPFSYEVNGVVSGLRAAFSTLARGNRASVDHATQDEEMFI